MAETCDEVPNAGYIDFGLDVVSDTESQFRFNTEGVFIPRETGVLVRCSLKDIVHGHATPDDHTPCTLVVFDFLLDRIKNARVIHEAVITIVLPEGVQVRRGGLAPDGLVSFDPQEQRVTRDTRTSVGVGFDHGVALDASHSRGESVEMETTDYATVRGWTTRQPRPPPNDPRPHNCIKWALLENQARKNGVPKHFRSAVLLERMQDDADSSFEIEMEISSVVDLKTAAQDLLKLLGKAPRGCLRINPRGLATANLRRYDTADLANNVKDICKISSGFLESERFSKDFM
ncbi:hypothetical protein SLS64_012515 [Diaporthe eres]